MTPERFRAIRKQLGLTQEELAERIGYRRAAQITVIETGKRPVPHLLGLLMEAYAAGYVPGMTEEQIRSSNTLQARLAARAAMKP